ncbi:hypothetical protein DF3PB_20015 [uncultured Defluviicoccus sp.]|uniref:Uncharacterized protein n=1 Tax=metagenome TaxID=256318 RepID=A0A380TB01_9ZZZZ|nr:hypothetical protein DF3PB_20015 [uncultured Defluviicoccus sp.]
MSGRSWDSAMHEPPADVPEVPFAFDGAADLLRCESAWNKDPVLVCAPQGGQIEQRELTGYAGPSEGEGRWPSTVVTASISSGRWRRNSLWARPFTGLPSVMISRAT